MPRLDYTVHGFKFSRVEGYEPRGCRFPDSELSLPSRQGKSLKHTGLTQSSPESSDKTSRYKKGPQQITAL